MPALLRGELRGVFTGSVAVVETEDVLKLDVAMDMKFSHEPDWETPAQLLRRIERRTELAQEDPELGESQRWFGDD